MHRNRSWRLDLSPEITDGGRKGVIIGEKR